MNNNKKGLIIIFVLVLVLVGLIIGGIFLVNHDFSSSDSSDLEQDSEIDTNDDTSVIEEIDFSNYKTYTKELSDTYKITKKGVYILSGNIEDGYIIVDTNDNVKIILNGISITNSNGPCIYIKNANVVYIELEEDTVNTLVDSSDRSNDELDGVIYSKEDLVLCGEGKLVINSNFEDGIVAKDYLKIESGEYEITSVDDGIRAKDGLIILGGTFNINAIGDGIKSTNENDTSKGYIVIENATIAINSEEDGIQAETDLTIKKSTLNINSGGGSANISTESSWGHWGNWSTTSQEDDSAKGIKVGNNLVIESGTFNIDSSDDSIHSNNSIKIVDGKFEMQSGDDGIHADNTLIIEGGEINILKSYEGLEAMYIQVDDGKIYVVASDDGMNAAGGSDSSSTNGRAGQNPFTEGGVDSKLTINGGELVINAEGDGLDANGGIYINGGKIIVYGPTNNGNGALDYNLECIITGGELIASGSSGMAETAGEDSTQNTIMINFDNTISTSSIISIKDEDGNEILSYQAEKEYQNLVYSSCDLKTGNTYTIYVDDSLYETFTIDSVSSTIGNSYGFGMGH